MTCFLRMKQAMAGSLISNFGVLCQNVETVSAREQLTKQHIALEITGEIFENSWGSKFSERFKDCTFIKKKIFSQTCGLRVWEMHS